MVKSNYGITRTIILANKLDENISKIRATAMLKGNTYSFGKVINSAILFALDKGFDQEKLIKIADEIE